MRIDPWDWARWTLKQFYVAYEGWAKINIHAPWERARAISFYSVAPYSDKIKKWEDTFPLDSDKLRKKSRQKSNAIMREMTEEEKQIYKQMLPNG